MPGLASAGPCLSPPRLGCALPSHATAGHRWPRQCLSVGLLRIAVAAVAMRFRCHASRGLAPPPPSSAAQSRAIAPPRQATHRAAMAQLGSPRPRGARSRIATAMQGTAKRGLALPLPWVASPRRLCAWHCPAGPCGAVPSLCFASRRRASVATHCLSIAVHSSAAPLLSAEPRSSAPAAQSAAPRGCAPPLPSAAGLSVVPQHIAIAS